MGVSLYVQAQETSADQKQGYINRSGNSIKTDLQMHGQYKLSARDEKKMAEGAFQIMKRTSFCNFRIWKTT